MQNLDWAIDNYLRLKQNADNAAKEATSSWGRNYWSIISRDLQRKIDALVRKMREDINVG